MSIIDIEKITLASGGHTDPDAGLCLLEAVAYVAGEPHSDHPQCVSPVLGAYGRNLNDRLADEDRQKLKPFIKQMIGTANDGLDEARGYLAADWAIRVATPRLLDAAGMTVQAETLRALAPVTDEATSAAARKAARSAREDAWARRSEARATLRSAVEQELFKRGLPVAVAVAAAAAVAAAVAVAAAAAAAVAADVAVAVAADVAVAAAVAVAADVAADVAAAAAQGYKTFEYGSDGYWAVRNAVRSALLEQWKSSELPFAVAVRENTVEAIALLGRMIDPRVS